MTVRGDAEAARPSRECAAVLDEGFLCECKHHHSLVKVLRWREVEIEISSWKHPRSRMLPPSTGVSIARRVKLCVGSNRLRSRQCALFFFSRVFFRARTREGVHSFGNAVVPVNTRGSRRADGESEPVVERRCLQSDAEKILFQVLHGFARHRVQTIPRVAPRAQDPSVPGSLVQRVFGCVQGGRAGDQAAQSEWQRPRWYLREAVVATWHRHETHHGPRHHEGSLQCRRIGAFRRSAAPIGASSAHRTTRSVQLGFDPGHHALIAPHHDHGWTSSERHQLHGWEITVSCM